MIEREAADQTPDDRLAVRLERSTLIVHSEGGSAVELAPDGTPVWNYEGTLATPDGHRVKIVRMRRI